MNYRKFVGEGILIGFVFVFAVGFYYFYLVPSSKALFESEAFVNGINQRVDFLHRMDVVNKEFSNFNSMLNRRDAFPAIIDHISTLGKNNSVKIPSIHYDEERGKSRNFRRVVVSFLLSGEYADIRKFIYELENAPFFVVIEDINLYVPKKNKEKDDAGIRAEVTLGAYFS